MVFLYCRALYWKVVLMFWSPYLHTWQGQNIKTTFQYNTLQYNTTHYGLNNKHKVGLLPFWQCQHKLKKLCESRIHGRAAVLITLDYTGGFNVVGDRYIFITIFSFYLSLFNTQIEGICSSMFIKIFVWCHFLSADVTGTDPLFL